MTDLHSQLRAVEDALALADDPQEYDRLRAQQSDLQKQRHLAEAQDLRRRLARQGQAHQEKRTRHQQRLARLAELNARQRQLDAEIVELLDRALTLADQRRATAKLRYEISRLAHLDARQDPDLPDTPVLPMGLYGDPLPPNAYDLLEAVLARHRQRAPLARRYEAALTADLLALGPRQMEAALRAAAGE